MKSRIYLLLIAIPLFLNAQAPEAMTYQAVVRDSGGAILSDTQVGMEIGIYQDAVTGTPVYTETHTPTTNSSGLLDIQIGAGSAGSGTFSDIDWSTGNYWLETKIDPAGGTNYTITGNSQLLSVPFAFHSNTTSSVNSSSSGANSSNTWLIPYMPYVGFSVQIIYVTSYFSDPNASSGSTQLSVEAIDENGNTYDLGVTTVITAEKITLLSNDILIALSTQGFTEGRVSLKLTSSTTDFDLYFHAAYTVSNEWVRTDVIKL